MMATRQVRDGEALLGKIVYGDGLGEVIGTSFAPGGETDQYDTVEEAERHIRRSWAVSDDSFAEILFPRDEAVEPPTTCTIDRTPHPALEAFKASSKAAEAASTPETDEDLPF
jgi:hypothetical protein